MTYWRPRDLRYSSRLPLDMYSVTIFRYFSSKTMPNRQTRCSCCSDLSNKILIKLVVAFYSIM